MSDGCSRTRFQGLVFDGQHVADVGVEHDAHAPGLFETRIRHQNNKFINFEVAGIRIGANTTDRKLETSEVLYENCIFAGNSNGIQILNFNDYDNTFDGCLFADNSYGIFTSKMANVYVRNSRFERSATADMALSTSAGNSVRRCVSVGSAAFVVSSHHSAVNPTTIEGCVVAGWTGPNAIDYNLRGPLLLLNNHFEPAANATAATVVVGNSPWPQVNQVLLLAGNTLGSNRSLAPSTTLLPVRKKNIYVDDLGTAAPLPPPQQVAASTQFLKTWWPGVPTALVDARDFGCNGAVSANDGTTSTGCVQATIDAAAKKGNGAAAYFAPGSYSINSTVSVPRGNYSVLGGGYQTKFVWSLRSKDTPAEQAVFSVQGGGGGLKLMHFQVVGTGSGIKIAHDGDGAGETGGAAPSPRLTTYDGVFTTDQPGGWFSSGVVVRNLPAGDCVHFVHLDGNLAVQDSSEGTVFANFFIQGSLNISAPRGTPQHAGAEVSEEEPHPSVGIATMVGLTDHDLNVKDDLSVVITDFYSEQIKTGHITLSGASNPNTAAIAGTGVAAGSRGGAAAAEASSTKGSKVPGRVTIAAAKSQCYTPYELTVDNYFGTIVYANSFFFEGPRPAITQTGDAEVNITLLGNAFWGDNSSALAWHLGAGAAGRNSAVGNLIADYGPGAPPQNQSYPDIRNSATNGTIANALADFYKLGALDLKLNHPDVY